MNIKGVYIFKSDSGVTLFSKRSIDVHEDLLSAFLAALKEFFSSLSLGECLQTFGTENFIFYLASNDSVTTALIIDQKEKTDRFFNLAFDICNRFYAKYKSYIDSTNAILIPKGEEFEFDLIDMISEFNMQSEKQHELIKLFKISKSENLETFEFINENELFNLPLFVAVNYVTKRIYVIENPELPTSNRNLYLANKAATNLNQMDFKSKFSIRNVSDNWDSERLINQISQTLKKESILI